MHPSPVFDLTGGDADWEVRAGCLWTGGGRLTDDGVGVDLTTVTIAAIVTANATSAVPLKTFTVVKTVPLDGQFTMTILEAAATLAVGRYWWAMEMNFGAGNEPMASGPFVVKPWVFP